MPQRLFIPGLVAVALVLLSATMASQVNAQYPPPPGSSASLVASDIAPALGETISIAVTIVDAVGDPVVGADCTFSIASQPGSDASIEAGATTTDASGVASATLNVGNTEGTIVVDATCGDVTAPISVITSAGEEPAAPPASLPDTGFGPDADAGTNPYFLALVLVALFGGIGTLYLSRRAR